MQVADLRKIYDVRFIGDNHAHTEVYSIFDYSENLIMSIGRKRNVGSALTSERKKTSVVNQVEMDEFYWKVECDCAIVNNNCPPRNHP